MPINTMLPCKFLGSSCNGKCFGDGLWVEELEVQQSSGPTGRSLVTSRAGLVVSIALCYFGIIPRIVDVRVMMLSLGITFP